MSCSPMHLAKLIIPQDALFGSIFGRHRTEKGANTALAAKENTQVILISLYVVSSQRKVKPL